MSAGELSVNNLSRLIIGGADMKNDSFVILCNIHFFAIPYGVYKAGVTDPGKLAFQAERNMEGVWKIIFASYLFCKRFAGGKCKAAPCFHKAEIPLSVKALPIRAFKLGIGVI